MARLKYFNPETNQWEYVDTSKAKSAYQYAAKAGYTGTEKEFSERLDSAVAIPAPPQITMINFLV